MCLLFGCSTVLYKQKSHIMVPFLVPDRICSSNNFHKPFHYDHSYAPAHVIVQPLKVTYFNLYRICSIRRRSRIVAAPRLLFENTSTWTCLVTRFQWQAHDKQSRTSFNLLLHQQRGQNLLDQWCQSTVSLRITSLAATGINKRRTNTGDEINSSRSV